MNGNYNDGITSKDGLVITDGTISVTAADDGIRGKDYLVVGGGTYDVTAEADAVEAVAAALISGSDLTLAADSATAPSTYRAEAAVDSARG